MSRIVASLIATSIFLLGALSANAATYSVAPLVLDYAIQPRDILHQDITITNIGGTFQSIFPTVNNITVGDGGGINEFLPPSMSDKTVSFSSWIEISRAPIHLDPGEVKKIPLTIHVNPDAAPGTYHAVVSFPVGGNRDEAEASVKRGGVPGVMLNATLDIKKIQAVRLSHFFVKTFLTKPEADAISIDVLNTGDTEVSPKGDVIIYNRRGEEVASVPINPLGENIKAGAEGHYTASVPLQGLLGKYKAFLSLSYGTTQGATLNDTVFFYAVPWKKLLIAFVLFSVVTVAIVLFVHLRRRRHSDVVEDEEEPDHDYLPLFFRDTISEAKHHDIDMKKKYDEDI